MPGYVIHLAVAEEYLKKHKKNEQYEAFIEGVVFPDGTIDKSKTHFGKGSSNSNLYEFLEKYNINDSFNRGYFLHLLTDYLFYNRYIDTFSKDMYNDYDILNAYLIEKYNVKLPEKAKEKVFFKEGKLKFLSKELTEKIIDEISNLDIDEVARDVIQNKEKWTRFRKLKKL